MKTFQIFLALYHFEGRTTTESFFQFKAVSDFFISLISTWRPRREGCVFILSGYAFE
jgi:hypothetical protein